MEGRPTAPNRIFTSKNPSGHVFSPIIVARADIFSTGLLSVRGGYLGDLWCNSADYFARLIHLFTKYATLVVVSSVVSLCEVL